MQVQSRNSPSSSRRGRSRRQPMAEINVTPLALVVVLLVLLVVLLPPLVVVLVLLVEAAAAPAPQRGPPRP